MRFPGEYVKIFAASLSLVAVAISFGVSALSLGWDSKGRLLQGLLIATIGAAISAALSIFATQRLRKRKRPSRVFIIYAREDLGAAMELYQVLKREGFNPWLDVESLSPGEIWRDKVLEALSESGVAIVLISRGMNKRTGFVQKEIRAALSLLQEHDHGSSPIIPVRLDDIEVPSYLTHIQWVDLFREGGLEQLMSALDATAERRPPNPTAQPD